MNRGQTDQQSRRDDVLRELLKNEFQKRAQKNPSFSLRAFAAKLGIDQSLLSKVLQGKRSFSISAAEKAASFLGIYLQAELTPTDSNFSLNGKMAQYEFIKEDEFFVISEWYHFAILELIKTQKFKHRFDSVSDRLGISTFEAKRAIERLIRLGFLKEQNKKWILTKPNNAWLDLEKTTAARKKLQKSLQEKSLNAIEDIEFALREHSSLVVAADPKLIPEVKKRITEFRRSLDKYLETHGTATEVYTLAVSFFPLTQLTKKDLKKKTKENPK